MQPSQIQLQYVTVTMSSRSPAHRPVPARPPCTHVHPPRLAPGHGMVTLIVKDGGCCNKNIL